MSVEADSQEFIDYMEIVKPPHEENVLKYFAAKRSEDIDIFAKKLEVENDHATSLGITQAEDRANLTTNIAKTENKVFYSYFK